ncbi:tRNA1(Val) (adenine(37)-N6)-methyltransferase [Nitratiruptor sp. YY09-18]|uniref:tRNA1(Val) (adenine(37)-N6)-methyltransferase n=1 Tax=Nitratiruptor sp. YY09-18 TaxID=2724901 RepID=UPI0019156859|nr:methyltransferase [Nitratiruptor sp. YY09-18]BCD68088.1 tRNA (adenine37-N(6))-methyltransferase TrmN6 [Nitratiruptor sp. YY09-18]
MIIYQPQEGYCYNSDTIFLYNFILQFRLFGDVLDVGTGSGILALLIKRDFHANVYAIEKQEKFVEYAKINTKANKLPIHLYLGDFLHMNFSHKFDFIISNPPFYHKDVIRSKNKMIDTARYSGHMPLEKFLQKANTILKPKGSLIFCYDAKQIQDIITKLTYYKFNLEVMQLVHPHKDKDATLVMIKAKKSSKSLTKILAPLIVFENGEYRPSTHAIFKRVGVHSIKCKV